MNIQIVGDPRYSDYQVKDVWTTVDGQWYVSGSPYSVPGWAVEEYFNPPNIDLGGAQHIFARVEDATGAPLYIPVEFGQHYPKSDDYQVKMPDKMGRWVEFPTWVVFYPQDGQASTVWHKPDGSDITLRGGGLPVGHHVSLFTVWTYNPDGGGGNGGGEDPDTREFSLTKDTLFVVRTNGHRLTVEVE